MPKNAPALAPLTASDFTSAFPGSRKVYVDGPGGVRVPMREIALTNGETLRVYDTSGPQGHDVATACRSCAPAGLRRGAGGSGVTQLHFARKGVVTARDGVRRRSARGSIRSSSARRSRAAAPSFPRTSITPSSSR